MAIRSLDVVPGGFRPRGCHAGAAPRPASHGAPYRSAWPSPADGPLTARPRAPREGRGRPRARPRPAAAPPAAQAPAGRVPGAGASLYKRGSLWYSIPGTAVLQGALFGAGLITVLALVGVLIGGPLRRAPGPSAFPSPAVVAAPAAPVSPPAGDGPSGPATPSVPRAQLTGVHLVESQEGRKLWEVTADKAEVFDGQSITRLEKLVNPVQVTLYSPEGTLIAWSDRVTIHMETKDVALEGHVRAVSESGTTLTTEALTWSSASRRLSTDRRVRVLRDGMVSGGVGLEAETTLERVRILRDITSEIGPGVERPGGIGPGFEGRGGSSRGAEARRRAAP